MRYFEIVETRYFEIVGGIRIPISQPEAEILDRAAEGKGVRKNDLKPFEQETARRMAQRGVLRYTDEIKKDAFVPNDDPSLTRF